MAVWTVVVALLLSYAVSIHRAELLEAARIQARTGFERDMIYRQWAADHGGVYVPVTEQTQPNLDLVHPRRDVVTEDGQTLTLVNPDFMIRQAHEVSAETTRVHGRITSLHPLHEGNQPDAWEARALRQFEQGEPEASTLAEIEGEEYMRLMRPLRASQKCLDCHTQPGLDVGGVVGGISVAVPLQPLQRHGRQQLAELAAGHGAIWLIGMAGLLVILRALTRRARIQNQAESRLADAVGFQQLLLETSLTGIFSVDTEMRITSVNQAFTEVLGYAPADVLGKHCSVLGGDPCCEHCRLFDEGGAGPVRGGQCSVLTKDGRRRVITKNNDFIRDTEGNITGAVESFMDITELVAARRRAEDASRTRAEFLANLSHEVRTPLNGVMGASQLLADTPINDEQRDYLTMVRDSAEGLMQVLNDVLDFCRLEKDQPELTREPFRLQECFSTTAQITAFDARQKDLQMQWRIDPSVPELLIGDPSRVRQVLVCLVGNAVKFTEAGGVDVSARLVESAGESEATVLIEVADTGPGISEADQERIFEAFVQADGSSTRRHGGTGLGLAIAGRLVARMGGRIWLESALGRGASFFFTFRTERSPDPARRPLPASVE